MRWCRAEALTRPLRRRQHLARIFGAVDAPRRVEAHVAIAARRDPFAEVLEQRHTPARRGLAIPEQRIEALVLAAPSLLARILVLDELAAHPDVRETVEHVRLGARAVAPGAADLLVVRLDAARQIGVEHVAHVRLVDPHPEGDGGDDDHTRLAHEHVLVLLARLGVHPRVIGKRADPARRKQRRRLLGLLPRQAVDDAARALVAGDERLQLPLPVALHLHRERDVRAVEAEHELLDLAAEKLLRDVLARHLVGGRGQRGDRHPGEALAQPAQLRVLGAKRRAPLRDAVGLIDREQRDRQPRKRREHALGHQPFRGHVEQPRLARRGASPRRHVPGALIARVDPVCRDAGELERRDLVPHQRHQRRHHHRETVTDQRRHLEAQRLSRARRHHGQHVAPRQQCLDHCLLARAELLEPEDVGKRPARGAHRRRTTASAAIDRNSWTVSPGRTIRSVCNASDRRSGCQPPALPGHRHSSPGVS